MKLGNSKVVVSKPIQVKTPTIKTPIHYTIHPKYVEVSSNTTLKNIGKDMTLMFLDGTINKDGNVTNDKLLVEKLYTMVKLGKRPPSSTKGGKEDYSDDMVNLELEVNLLIKGKQLTNKKGHIIKPMFYMRNETLLKQNKGTKTTGGIKTTGIKVVQTK